jgi:hypothetical protein
MIAPPKSARAPATRRKDGTSESAAAVSVGYFRALSAIE